MNGTPVRLAEEDRCRVVSVIEGHVQVLSSSESEPLAAGESLVIPAACGSVVIEPSAGAVLLEELPNPHLGD
jgi:mannose-6-phosphate isomerase class I